MSHDSRIDEILDRWEASKDDGDEISLEELCGDDVELLRAVKIVVQQLQTADNALGQATELNTTLRGGLDETLRLDSEVGRLDLHAKGGLGVIYQGEDRVLNRRVAVKFIREQYARDRESRERFQLEREITGRLEHPGIVPVYGVGQAESGRLFYAMRFIDGMTLDVAIKEFHQANGKKPIRVTNRTLRGLLTRFVTVCQTVAFAHNRGIIHRDIKPDNVMLGRFGETLLVDWGLAIPFGREGVFKQNEEKTLTLHAGSGSSTSGRGAGTPPYMSPEQFSYEEILGPATDIYSLGAMLYKLLTGNAPFQGPLEEVRRQVVGGRLVPPTQVNPRISRSLEAICLKAMARGPQDRYLTAIEMAKDIERCLADAPVSVRRDTPLQKMGRWLRRHWTVAQGLLFGLLFVTIIVLFAAVAAGRYAQNENLAKVNAVAAQISERHLRRQALHATAEFAAKTIGNLIEIRWRVLENVAADSDLQEQLIQVNERPEDQQLWAPLQATLDRYAAANASIPNRSWFINARDGLQVASTPLKAADDEVVSSVGRSYAYRDYFHGLGRDYDSEEEQPWRRPPLNRVHNSTAMESTNDGQLIVVFSVPIRARRSEEVIGVLGLSITLGTFADLGVALPDGQTAMLVETRQYFMKRTMPTPHRETGEGLVLHHPRMRELSEMNALPHIRDEATLQLIRNPRSTVGNNENVLNDFKDPVTGATGGVASFAPVTIDSRAFGPQQQSAASADAAPQPAQTGWTVIVFQSQ